MENVASERTRNAAARNFYQCAVRAANFVYPPFVRRNNARKLKALIVLSQAARAEKRKSVSASFPPRCFRLFRDKTGIRSKFGAETTRPGTRYTDSRGIIVRKIEDVSCMRETSPRAERAHVGNDFACKADTKIESSIRRTKTSTFDFPHRNRDKRPLILRRRTRRSRDLATTELRRCR